MSRSQETCLLVFPRWMMVKSTAGIAVGFSISMEEVERLAFEKNPRGN